MHYASYESNGQEVHGTAELITGGYIFRADDNPHKAMLVDYRNADLTLYGLKPLADEQWSIDCASGDLATLGAR
jgi:hypothetical protein